MCNSKEVIPLKYAPLAIQYRADAGNQPSLGSAGLFLLLDQKPNPWIPWIQGSPQIQLQEGEAYSFVREGP